MIKNIITGKIYVGSAVDLERRKKEHFRRLDGGCHHSKKLQNSFNKHGASAFKFIVLVRVVRADSLVKIEQEYIDYLGAFGPNGYNSRPKAESNLGHKFSAAIVEKNRLGHIGKKQSPETIEKRIAPLRGKPLTDSHKKALGDSKRGKPRPDVKKWAPEKFSRFSVSHVLAMRADKAAGMTYRLLAEKYKCNISTAYNAVNGIGEFYSRIFNHEL